VNDFERRLADALHDAVDQANPPGGLVDLIRRRHRRYRTRVGIASVAATAAVVAISLPLAVPAISAGPAPVGPSAPGAANPAAPVARPGTVLQDCSDRIGLTGQYAAGWQRQSIQAGPLWFMYVRKVSANNGGTSPLPYGNLPVNVKDSSVAWVRVIGAARHYFRFLYGPANTGSGSYTLRDGEAGITFAACRPGHALGAFYPGYTQFWGGFVMSRVPACVSLGVWTTTASKPITVTFPVGSIRCAHAW